MSILSQCASFHKTLYVYSKTCVKQQLSNSQKIGFQDQFLLNAGQMYCRCSKGSILQNFRPSLSYHLSLRSLFCLFLSGRFTQVLLYLYFLAIAMVISYGSEEPAHLCSLTRAFISHIHRVLSQACPGKSVVTWMKGQSFQNPEF